MIIIPFNSFNSNDVYIKKQNCQIMAAITNITLKFESMIKKPLMASHTFFAVVTFAFAYINSIVIQHYHSIIHLSIIL